LCAMAQREMVLVGAHDGAGARAGATAQRDDNERREEEWLHHERGDGAVRESALWGAR
jgi:hypothetical protein